MTEKEITKWKDAAGTYLGNIWGHDEIISAIQADIEAGRRKSYLLYGPPGTGKTSTGKAIGAHYGSLLDLNGSDDKGIDVVRGKIKTRARTASITGGPQVILLDEFEEMTNPAQSALKRVLEDYEDNCIFILCTNNINKVIEPIRSRCEGSTYYMGPLSREDLEMLLADVCETMGHTFTEDETDRIIRLSRGLPRNALLIAQTIADGNSVASVVNGAEMFMAHVLSKDPLDLYEAIKHVTFDDVPTMCDIVLTDVEPGIAHDMIEAIGDAEARAQNTHNKDLHLMNLAIQIRRVYDGSN